MKNIEALSRLCTAIANTFYPDMAVLEFALAEEGLHPQEESAAKDAKIFRTAVRLVRGYVESSRSENAISASVREDAVERSLRYWCGFYGLDADDELGDSLRTISDATDLW